MGRSKNEPTESSSYYDDPELIQHCLNCTQENCTGDCEYIRIHKKRKKSLTAVKTYEYNGKTYTKKDLMAITGLTYNTISKKLIKYNGDVGKVLEEGCDQRTKKHIYKGESCTVKQLAKKAGVSEQTFRQYMFNHNFDVNVTMVHYLGKED